MKMECVFDTTTSSWKQPPSNVDMQATKGKALHPRVPSTMELHVNQRQPSFSQVISYGYLRLHYWNLVDFSNFVHWDMGFSKEMHDIQRRNINSLPISRS